jgi:beta-lactamase regulating signal transducer with metallopeptidase domain
MPMHFTAFENAYFLQSIGWAIINSFWQAAVLWFAYLFSVSFNKKISAVFKYNLSLLFLFAAFTWFIFTIITTFVSLKNSSSVAGSIMIPVQELNFYQVNNLLPYLSFLYAGLLCFYITRFIISYKKIIVLQKTKLLKSPLDLRMFIKNITAHIGIKKKVSVWLSELVDVPSVIGFIKPVILLPASIVNHLSTEQLEAVLLHELAHIKRNDFLINLLQSIIEIILFFNPFATLLNNYAKKERENCCDDWVLNYQYNKHHYASALLILEEQRRQYLLLAMAATNKKNILLKRIKRMFYIEPKTTISFTQKLQMVVVTVFLFAGIIFLVPFKNNNSTNKPLSYIEKTIAFNLNQPLPVIYPINIEEPSGKLNTELFKSKPGVIKKINEKRPQPNNTDNNYTIALINNDLLKKNKQPVAISANEEENQDTSYYVKIEEEQSGKEQMNVYYFELKKNKGNTNIKPLMLLRKSIQVDVQIKNTFDSSVSAVKRVTL